MTQNKSLTSTKRLYKSTDGYVYRGLSCIVYLKKLLANRFSQILVKSYLEASVCYYSCIAAKGFTMHVSKPSVSFHEHRTSLITKPISTLKILFYRVSKKKLMLFQIQISCEFHHGVFPWVYKKQILIKYTVRKPQSLFVPLSIAPCCRVSDFVLFLTILARLKLCILTSTGN